jgi:hypothetical protein
MLSRDQIIDDVRQVLEQHYLQSANDDSKNKYAQLSEIEKRTALKTFLQDLTVASDGDEWAIRLGETL